MLSLFNCDHGNLKPSNIFVDYTDKKVGSLTQKMPVLVLADRCLVGKPTSDLKALANIMH